jgi:hypothetical protein
MSVLPFRSQQLHHAIVATKFEICRDGSPSAASSTTRARATSRWAVFAARIRVSNTARISSSDTIAAHGAASPEPYISTTHLKLHACKFESRCTRRGADGCYLSEVPPYPSGGGPASGSGTSEGSGAVTVSLVRSSVRPGASRLESSEVGSSVIWRYSRTGSELNPTVGSHFGGGAAAHDRATWIVAMAQTLGSEAIWFHRPRGWGRNRHGITRRTRPKNASANH